MGKTEFTFYNFKISSSMERSEEMYETVVMGSGPAGLSAALYLKRAGKNVIVIEKEYEGTGQIMQSICVDNYLGIPSVSGETLGERFRQHVLDAGVIFLEDEAEKILYDGKNWYIRLLSGKNIETETILYAAGAVPKTLGIPGEKEFLGRGISYCAYCDGSLYRGKEVAVIGGGDTALDDALYLSGLCRKVSLIHRRTEFRGNGTTLEILKKRENVEIITEASVIKAEGQKKLEEIVLDNGEKLSVSGLFVAIGSMPVSDAIKGHVERDLDGYVYAQEDGITIAPGLFVAGDVRKKKLRQVITAVSDGANAAASAMDYLKFT